MTVKTKSAVEALSDCLEALIARGMPAAFNVAPKANGISCAVVPALRRRGWIVDALGNYNFSVRRADAFAAAAAMAYNA